MAVRCLIGCGVRTANQFSAVDTSTTVAAVFEAMGELDICVTRVVMAMASVYSMFQ